MIQLPTEFRASLESYRGPLDLLLYLVKKEEVDILDIPISRITEQYLVYIQILKSIDPNICGEFLVMAARLMEIKSRTLLPVVPAEEEDEEHEDPRLELVLQLLEYKKYKERALVLERLAEEHSQRYRRPETDLADLGEVADEVDGAPGLGNVSVWDLLTAFHRVQMGLSLRQPHRVLFEDRPVEEYIRAIETRLEDTGEASLSFEDLFEDCRDRYDAIGFFLAILEMAKQGLITFQQDEIFGEIRVVRCESPPPGPVVAEIDAGSPLAVSNRLIPGDLGESPPRPRADATSEGEAPGGQSPPSDAGAGAPAQDGEPAELHEPRESP